MISRQMVGIGGSLILFLGVFAPIVSVPFAGSLNYFQNGRGDGTIILALAVGSFVLAALERYGTLWFTGALSALVLLFTFVNFQNSLSVARTQMDLELAGNPFRGFADIAVQAVQLQWGWAVLVIGTVALISAAAMRDAPSSQNESA